MIKGLNAISIVSPRTITCNEKGLLAPGYWGGVGLAGGLTVMRWECDRLEQEIKCSNADSQPEDVQHRDTAKKPLTEDSSLIVCLHL